MKKAKLLLVPLLAISSFILGGCAFAVHDVEVNSEFTGNILRPLDEATTDTLSLGQFQDRRSNAVSDRMIFQITNLNGDRTSGGWQAQKPVAELVKDSISDGLEKAELKILPSGGDLELTGELVDLDYEIITGWWSGQLNSEMTVKVMLKDQTNGKILWKETYFSKDSTDKFEMELIFERLLQDMVQQLIEDDYFRQVLTENSNPPPVS